MGCDCIAFLFTLVSCRVVLKAVLNLMLVADKVLHVS